MSTAAEPARHRYVLPVTRSISRGARKGYETRPIDPTLYLRNAAWFCRLRWLVIGLFAAYGALSYLPGFGVHLELQNRLIWPFLLAGVLLLANVAFLAWFRLLDRNRALSGARWNLWLQIIFDLVIVTIAVHRVGSIETYAPFVYLFHIVLACVFFSRLHSFFITGLAIAFYLACVGLETSGMLPPSSVYANDSLRGFMDASKNAALINIVSAVFIWSGVWFLTSRFALLLREREHELAETNRRLVESQKERTHHMLRTTHELKAPFAAIHANTQLLLKGYCGPLEADAKEAVQKIANRSRRLTDEIQLMLQLANLRSSSTGPLPMQKLDVGTVLHFCLTQVSQIAEEFGVAIVQNVQGGLVSGVEDHLKMVFINLLSNAILYSHRGGDVVVDCRDGGDGFLVVSVEDHGIGIPKDKLPKIFDEYFRTKEAAQHNKNSTGLGLALVRHVAETHGIGITVESREGEGTKFVLRIPRVA